MNNKEMIGNKFGKLTVIEYLGTKGKNHKRSYHLCKCECGNEKIVLTQHLKNGHIKSCGCLVKELNQQMKYSKTHGLSKTKIYEVWCNIKSRCYNKNDYHYKWYGEKGIKMCDEWFNDFTSFYKWSNENGYDENLTIDRINNNGNYEPNNCRWVDIKTQCNNRKSNLIYTYNNETTTLKELTEKYNVSYQLVWQRLKRGWNIQEAIEY